MSEIEAPHFLLGEAARISGEGRVTVSERRSIVVAGISLRQAHARQEFPVTSRPAVAATPATR